MSSTWHPKAGSHSIINTIVIKSGYLSFVIMINALQWVVRVREKIYVKTCELKKDPLLCPTQDKKHGPNTPPRGPELPSWSLTVLEQKIVISA